MTFTNIFGGNTINPAEPSYKSYTTGISIELDWPFEALDGERVVADKIDVIATATAITFTLPDATLASNGEDILWNNLGTNAFTVLAFNGTTVIVVQPGQQWFTYLADNSTPGGVWHTTQFGAGSSSGNAGALAGFGMRARGTQLDQNLLTNISGGAITLDASSRAQVFRHTGGSIVHNIASVTTLGPTPMASNGWFVVEINAGSGNLVITPQAGELIDGAATKVIAPGESLTVYCFGPGFQTMGHGRAISSNVQGISIDASGTGEMTLNAAQIAAQVQDYVGTVVPPRTIIYGPGTGYWMIYNHTNGPLIIKGATGDSPVTIVQDAFSILRSQGGALDIAFTATSGTVTSIATVATEITGGPITTSGTLGLANTGVAPGTYGDASHVAQVQLDAKGRAVTASSPAIVISINQISDVGNLLPTGMVAPYAGYSGPPANWLFCDGTLYLVANYPTLFAYIGNLYGGDGVTNFATPDLRGRTVAGFDAGTGRLRHGYFNYPDNWGSGSGVDAVQYNSYLGQLIVRVGDWYAGGNFGASGYTTGAQSVHYGANTWTTYGSRGTVSSGDATEPHAHYYEVHANTSGESLGVAINSFGAYGRTDAVNVATDVRTNVQPTMVMRWIIKI